MVIPALVSEYSHLTMDWTTSESGFDYRRVQRVFFSMWEGQGRETCVKLQIISAGRDNGNIEIWKQDGRVLRHTDRLCGLVVRVPGYRSRGPGSISGATTFSEK
jgi:hypothetical protein